ncbi:MAG: cyclopropane fatty acyl phospholipid synthase [Gammaproteobacteria bacterium]|nr:cyclopropane fatty acyl phospholipid synthase [Gammaproteobacteria bacterium]
MADLKKTVENILETVDVQVNGPRPWDIQIHNEGFYARVLGGGSLGLGESYMDGWWDCEAVDQFMTRILGGRIDKQVKGKRPSFFLMLLRARFSNAQSKKRAYIVGEKHYDMGNDLFSLMLDERMNYSCGFWKEADNLNQAQEDKLDLICRKMQLEPGMSVLEIGCGWGAFAKYAAENYGVSVYGVTISKEQKILAEEICQGLNVTFELKDYRELNTEYDRIVSIGMFEHVGYKNYREYMEVANRCLKDDGLFLLHTIGRNTSDTTTDAWTNKYIFPNGMTPSTEQVGAATEGLLQIEDWHSFGQYYDTTLMAWHDNFQRHWSEIEGTYDERFRRMWQYYLLTAAASFRARRSQLWQLVLSKGGVRGGYSYKNNPRFEQDI